MKGFRAIVRNGRLIIEDDVPLPEGTEVDLEIADPGDDLSAKERRALHQALKGSWASARKGRIKPVSDLVRKLRPRG